MSLKEDNLNYFYDVLFSMLDDLPNRPERLIKIREYYKLSNIGIFVLNKLSAMVNSDLEFMVYNTDLRSENRLVRLILEYNVCNCGKWVDLDKINCAKSVVRIVKNQAFVGVDVMSVEYKREQEILLSEIKDAVIKENIKLYFESLKKNKENKKRAWNLMVNDGEVQQRGKSHRTIETKLINLKK